MKWLKEHKKACIGIVVLLIIVIAVIVIKVKGKDNGTTVTEEVAVVEERTLMKSVSATGSFIAADEEKITSDTIGVEVVAVNVEVGDTVAAGDVICVLDTEDLQERLKSAQDMLDRSKTQSSNAKESAQRGIEQAKKDRDENLAEVDKNIAEAKEEWDYAESLYAESERAYKEAEKVLEGMTDKTSPQYISAQAQVTGLKRQMESDRRIADAAKANYDALVARKESDIQRINNAYQDQVDALQRTIDSEDDNQSLQDQIKEIQKQIDGAKIKATSNGLVTAVNVEVGDRYNGSVIAVIDNVDSFDITTEIDEYDINSIEVGQKVIIKTNATGEEEMQGTVKKVSPIATGTTSGDIMGSLGLDLGGMVSGGSAAAFGGGSDDVTFTVTIALNDKNEKIRIGMTAKLNIVLQENTDVLSLPYNAVQTDDNETFFVQKITGKNEDGTYKTEKISVVKGIESDYYTEILDTKLKAGDKVLLPPVEKGTDLKDMIDSSSSMGGV